MPKTYTAAGTVVAGEVYTAAAHNIIATDVNNLIVPPAVRAIRTTNQSIATSSLSQLSFDSSAQFDTDSMYSSAAPTRITINTTGIYIVTCRLTCGAFGVGTGTLYMEVLKNGAATVPISADERNGRTEGANEQGLAVILELVATDYLQVNIFQNSGTAKNYKGHLAATWIGRTS
jgi:hypothetical protein